MSTRKNKNYLTTLQKGSLALCTLLLLLGLWSLLSAYTHQYSQPNPWFLGVVLLGSGSLFMMLIVLHQRLLNKVDRVYLDIIQELQEHEEQLNLALKSAEQANLTKSEFLATMSHELRTPLNAIIGFSEVLLDMNFGPLNEKQREYVHDVWESGKHLLLLINDILDLSKVEAGKMDLYLSKIDLNWVVKNSLLMIKERALNHSLKIEVHIEEAASEIRGDERKIKQILFNLLSNAAKFTPDGGSVGLTAKPYDGEAVLLTVWDTGIGIDPKDHAKVFQEFVRIDNAYTRKTPGTGLGLALTKKMVELHGGKIWFDSLGIDQGTSFNFTLPRDPAKHRLKVSV